MTITNENWPYSALTGPCFDARPPAWYLAQVAAGGDVTELDTRSAQLEAARGRIAALEGQLARLQMA